MRMIIQTETRAQHKTLVKVFHSALDNFAIECFEAWQVTLSKVNGLFTVTIDDVCSTQREDIAKLLTECEEERTIPTDIS